MHSNWFFIALLPPILWSIVNHIDKFLLSKYFRGRGINTIFLFSSLFSLVVLPCIAFFTPASFWDISMGKVFFLLAVGVLNATAFYLYLKALNEEETSIVIPLLQMIPVIGYFLAYPILGEVLSSQQVLYALIVILGISILSLEFENHTITLRTRVFALVFASSFLFALHDVLFKKVTVESNFLTSAFWQYSGLSIVGIIIFICSSTERNRFIKIFTKVDRTGLGLNIASEVLYICGNLANSFATMLAPVALVLVVSSYQPLFVLILGTILSVFLPAISSEKITRAHLFQKISAIVIILIGSYFLYASSL